MISRRYKIIVKSGLYRIASIITGSIILYLVPKWWIPVVVMCAIESVHFFQFCLFDLIWKRWIKYRWFERARK